MLSGGEHGGKVAFMAKSELSDGTVGFLRLASVVSGLGMIAFGLLADRLGLSAEGGLSRNQIIALALGVFLVFAGILGRRFPGFYRGVAVIVLNLVMLAVILELASVVVMKLLPPESLLVHERKVQEGHLEEVQAAAVQGVYAPFVVWRSNPRLNCDSVTVSGDGFRVVPGASRAPDAFRVFLFGGSAMWGMNVSDRNTIPAFLQSRLDDAVEGPVEVFNFAQTGHSSTQEVIELALQIRNGNLPDVVVFYDGFNDVWGAYESGAAGGHHSQRLIAARVEGRPEAFLIPNPLQAIFQRTNIGMLVAALRGRINERVRTPENLETYRTMGVPVDSLARDIVDTYTGNADLARTLGDHYGFRCIFVWQPSVWYGDKVLTEEEEEIHQGGFEFFLAGDDPAFKELYTAAYSLFDSRAAGIGDFRSYAGAFDEVQATVYNDYSGVHVEPFANAMIADMLASEVLPWVPGDR